MPTPLRFLYADEETPCHLTRIDRRKLYGYVETQVVNDEDQECSLATLTGDGRTLVGAGDYTLASIDADGLWCEKQDLTAVDANNEPVTAAPSSFKAPVTLEQTADITDYLSHNVRAVYALETEGQEGFSPGLRAALEGGTIFKFPFSYRGGLDPDVGFLLAGPDGTIWLALGKPTDIRLVGLEQAPATVPDEEDGGEEPKGDELLDFGIL